VPFSEGRKVAVIAAIVRHETARFTEQRKPHARLVEAGAKTQGEM
jgi:hypothetical protein